MKLLFSLLLQVPFKLLFEDKRSLYKEEKPTKKTSHLIKEEQWKDKKPYW